MWFDLSSFWCLPTTSKSRIRMTREDFFVLSSSKSRMVLAPVVRSMICKFDNCTASLSFALLRHFYVTNLCGSCCPMRLFQFVWQSAILFSFFRCRLFTRLNCERKRWFVLQSDAVSLCLLSRVLYHHNRKIKFNTNVDNNWLWRKMHLRPYRRNDVNVISMATQR